MQMQFCCFSSIFAAVEKTAIQRYPIHCQTMIFRRLLSREINKEDVYHENNAAIRSQHVFFFCGTYAESDLF